MDFCLFCAIAGGEIPSSTLYEDEKVRVFLDLGPASRGHALVVPKKHFRDAAEAPAELMGHMMAVAARVGRAQMKAFGYEGFNLVQNNGEAAGQSVFHLHIHVIPRKTGDGVLGLWTPGTAAPGEMEETVQALRAALQGETP